MQGSRVRANNQDKALEKTGAPHAVLSWLKSQDEVLESQIKRALDKYTDAHPIGIWAKSIVGIGPVISAGLISSLAVEKEYTNEETGEVTLKTFETAGDFYGYCGLNPEQKKIKGQKINWNPALKRLCWIIGESFVKISGHDEGFYGKIYKERKEYETKKNEAGDYAEQSKATLEAKKFSKDTEAYKAYSVGKLPLAHIHERSKRYAVKIFLSHLHDVWYFMHFNKLPPKPYAINKLGHVHIIYPPNLHLVEGMKEAYGL